MRDIHELWFCIRMDTQMESSWVPTTETFGARLALIRWRLGWNMKEAALACGVSQQSWRGWETLGHEPRGLVAVAEQIARRTGVDEYWIMTGKSAGPRPGGPVHPAPADLAPSNP